MYLPNGLLNVTSCKYNAPYAAYVSFPHFYKADPELLNQFHPDSDLFPNKEDHESYMTIDPKQGIPLEAAVRMQINVLYRPFTPYLQLFEHTEPIFFPGVWFEVRHDIAQLTNTTTTMGPDSTTTTSSASCPDEPGWLQVEDSCYMVSVERMSWFAAQQFCWSHEGYLAEIDSQQEDELLDQMMLHEVQYWIGLNDLASEGRIPTKTNNLKYTVRWQSNNFFLQDILYGLRVYRIHSTPTGEMLNPIILVVTKIAH